MKTKLILIAIGSSLLLFTPVLQAEDAPTTTSKSATGKKHPPRGENLLPPKLVEKLNLSEDQKAKIKQVEDKFDKTRADYFASHKAEIDAARAAGEEAKKAGDDAKKKAARNQMSQAMSGLGTERKAAIDQVRAVLTEEQKKILDEGKPKRKEGAPKKAPAPAS